MNNAFSIASVRKIIFIFSTFNIYHTFKNTMPACFLKHKVTWYCTDVLWILTTDVTFNIADIQCRRLLTCTVQVTSDENHSIYISHPHMFSWAYTGLLLCSIEIALHTNALHKLKKKLSEYTNCITLHLYKHICSANEHNNL